MVRHIVIFKLKEEIDAQKRKEVMENFRDGIVALPAVIDYIRDIRVDFNINADEACDICLTSTFDSLEDVKAYSVHPSHKAVQGGLKPYVAVRSCVDFVV